MSSYQHSVAVDPEVARGVSCFTTLPIRIHLDSQAADQSSRWFLENIQSFASGRTYSKDISFSPVGHYAALVFPECPPDRLVAIAKACDLMWFEDDSFEHIVSQDERSNWRENTAGFVTLLGCPRQRLKAEPRYMQFVTGIIMEWLERDDKQEWVRLLGSMYDNLSTMTKDPTGAMTFEEYKSVRWIHSGSMLVEFFLSIALGISLSSVEKSSLEDIVRPLRDAAVFINDYYSYDKEVALHRMRKNPGRAFNGVAVLMAEHSITQEEALAMLKEMILESEQQHVTAFEEARRENRLTEKLLRYVEGWRYFTSGNSLWHAASPRYASALPPTTDGTVPVFEGTTGGKHFENDELTMHDQNGLFDDSNIAAHFQTLSPRLLDPRRLRPGEEIVAAPFHYLASLSSKKTREIFIHSLCAWLDVPIPDVEQITLAVSATHNVTLMLDDIEDESALRRQQPSAHAIFGRAQTINSANYMFLSILKIVQKLSNPECVAIFQEECENLGIGQGMELNWRHCKACPTMDEYITMVDNKTGSLLNFATRLMQAQGSTKCEEIPEIVALTTLFGRYFQIRDDLKNLTSEEYTAQKGFCEDLDEGKYSFPLIHALNSSSNTDRNMILGMLYNPPKDGLTVEMKRFIQIHMRDKTKSFMYAENALESMKDEVLRLTAVVEGKTGVGNPMFRMLIRGLSR